MHENATHGVRRDGVTRGHTLDDDGGERREEHGPAQGQQGGHWDRGADLVAHDHDHAGSRHEGPYGAPKRESLEADRRRYGKRHEWCQCERHRAHRRRRAAHADVEERRRDDERQTEQQGANEVRTARERDVQRDRQGREDGHSQGIAQGRRPESQQFEATKADRHRYRPGD